MMSFEDDELIVMRMLLVSEHVRLNDKLENEDMTEREREAVEKRIELVRKLHKKLVEHR